MKKIILNIMVIAALLLMNINHAVYANDLGLDITPVFYKGAVSGSGEITVLRSLDTIESGNIIAGIKVNYLSEGSVAPRVFVALYEMESSKLRLNSVHFVEPSTISHGGDAVECAVGVNVPDDGKEYKIIVMTWKNDADMAKVMYKRFVLGTSPSESVSVGEESGNISQLIEFAQASEYSLLRADWESENNVLQFVNE